MQARWNDAVIATADDDAIVVIEGNAYFPADAVDRSYVRPSTTTTTCPWKGEAGYYDVVVGDAVNSDAAWHYDTPLASAVERVGADFSGYVAFWRGVTVGD